MPLLILILFGVYHGFVTIVNHAQFRTHAYDWGNCTHVVSVFGQFRFADAVIDNATSNSGTTRTLIHHNQLQ